MHFGCSKSPENVSSGCKCRFIVVNRCVPNHTRNFQAAEKNVATHLGGAVHRAPGGPTSVREYVFTFFFKIQKRDFLRFFEVSCQKT